MRNKEQFKAYVYEKADAAHARNKRTHAAWARGAVAFSLLVVVGGAFLYANDNSMDKAMASMMENATNASIEMALFEAETGAPAEVYDYGNFADAISVEDSCENLPATAAQSDTVYKSTATAETMAALYSFATAAPASLRMDYAVATTASEYSGDLTNIDFAKNVAIVVTLQTDIVSWEIQYGEDAIIIAISVGNTRKGDTVYTILLEKEKYTGQEIEIYYGDK